MANIVKNVQAKKKIASELNEFTMKTYFLHVNSCVGAKFIYHEYQSSPVGTNVSLHALERPPVGTNVSLHALERPSGGTNVSLHACKPPPCSTILQVKLLAQRRKMLIFAADKLHLAI